MLPDFLWAVLAFGTVIFLGWYLVAHVEKQFEELREYNETICERMETIRNRQLKLEGTYRPQTAPDKPTPIRFDQYGRLHIERDDDFISN